MAQLSQSALRKLPVGDKISGGGIVAERTAAGVHLSVNVMIDGRRVHRRFGVGASLAEARQFIEQSRTDARRGRLNLPSGRKLALRFEKAAGDYLDRLRQAGGKNIPIKARQLRMHLVPFFADDRLDQISAFALERYKKARRAAGAAAATVNRELATLSHLLNRAVEWKWIDRLPARPKKYEEEGRILALDDQQVEALMTAAIGSSDPDLWLFVAIALGTSMRHQEILAARWDQLDLPRRRLFIPKAKAGKREQPITAELAGILAQERDMREDQQGYLFPARNKDSGSGHLARMDRPFRDAVKRAGLDPAVVTPHVLRHTAITRLVEAGVDLPTVQRISGHKTLTMVLRYAHVRDPHIDAAIDNLARVTPKLHQPSPDAGRPKLAKG
ncbi:MAG TPA: site-specific integrase [Stellaceae bacterium]|jgi:integrase